MSGQMQGLNCEIRHDEPQYEVSRGLHGLPVTPSWDVSELGALLKKRRKDRNLSLRDVADQSGVSLNTLSRVERGHIPDLPNFRRIIEWLDVPADAFLDPTGKAMPTPKVIARHLRADPNLTSEAAEEIANLVEEMYLQLAPKIPQLAIHLRSHKTFTPAAGDLLAQILSEIQTRLAPSVAE
ncbi:MAG: helix-turn-helix domain-containing protein [Candidatus Binatia bacterium]